MSDLPTLRFYSLLLQNCSRGQRKCSNSIWFFFFNVNGVFCFIYNLSLQFRLCSFFAAEWASSSRGERGLLSVAVHQRLIVAVLLLWSVGSRLHRLQQLRLLGSQAQAQQLQSMGLVAPWHVGSYQTWDRTCLLNRQADSLPLSHQGSHNSTF